MTTNLATRASQSIVVAALLLGVAAPAFAARTFCCTDERNQRRCGDVVPDACRGRAYTEYNEAGVQVRKVAAPLTEAEQAAKDAEEKKKQMAADAAAQQQRADQALLSTYADENDLNTARDRAVGEVERSLKAAETNLVELNKTKAGLQAEVAALKGKPVPYQLKRKIERNQTTINDQQTVFDLKKKELEETQAKFEGFRKRLRELKGEGAAAPASAR